MRTYLIEPQAIFVPYLRRMLESAGLDVIATHHTVDGKELAAHAPHAVFVDIDYFDRSGPTMICRIREALRNAVVIALSETTDPTFRATCVISGANAVCSKKDGEESVLRSLRGALARVASGANGVTG
jgi:DNA-binding NarL/FixJ family response regulator